MTQRCSLCEADKQCTTYNEVPVMCNTTEAIAENGSSVLVSLYHCKRCPDPPRDAIGREFVATTTGQCVLECARGKFWSPSNDFTLDPCRPCAPPSACIDGTRHIQCTPRADTQCTICDAATIVNSHEEFFVPPGKTAACQTRCKAG